MPAHPAELLDVVDENNVVIDQVGRQEVHDRNLLHRAIHLILTTDDGHFLLQQRSDSAPTYPGRWDSSVSGHVKAGETFDETVVQEAQEEIGYKTNKPPPVLLIEGSPDTDYEWVQFYAERVETPPSLRPNSADIKTVRWWSKEELGEALVKCPEQFTPVLSIVFFLWRQSQFLVPEEQRDEWYHVDMGNANRLQVGRGLLEAAGFRARVEEDEHWLAPHGGRSFFGSRRDARHTVLCVPREALPEAIALLYLSQPADDEGSE